ncbi:MAG: hypothetical protein Q8O23_04155, partial [Gallionella sp.]|nr:hypothetical protein [Gallionella sp.]
MNPLKAGSAANPFQGRGQTAKRAEVLHLPVWRMRILALLLLLWFIGLFGRALFLQGLNNEFLRQKGDARTNRVVEITAHRGMITDRHGEPLAISTPVEAVSVSPRDLEITPVKLGQLAGLLEMDKADLTKRINQTQR